MAPMVITAQGTKVRFAWTALSGAQENGDTVSSYIVSILDRTDMVFRANNALCNAGDSVIMSQGYCEVEMAAVKSGLNYSNGQYIYAKVQAVNAKGISVLSDVGTPL